MTFENLFFQDRQNTILLNRHCGSSSLLLRFANLPLQKRASLEIFQNNRLFVAIVYKHGLCLSGSSVVAGNNVRNCLDLPSASCVQNESDLRDLKVQNKTKLGLSSESN